MFLTLLEDRKYGYKIEKLGGIGCYNRGKFMH